MEGRFTFLTQVFCFISDHKPARVTIEFVASFSATPHSLWSQVGDVVHDGCG